jgi:GTP-binding protein LepA
MPPLGNSGWNNLRLRNFSILTYIDHGKSTPVACLLKPNRTLTAPDMKAQLLDGLDLE